MNVLLISNLVDKIASVTECFPPSAYTFHHRFLLNSMGSRYNTDDNNYIKLYSFQSIFTRLFICELGNSSPGLDEAHINPSLALKKSVFSKGSQVLGGQSQ